MGIHMNRREALMVGAASLASFSLGGVQTASAAHGVSAALAAVHDERLRGRMGLQILDADSRWFGGVPDGHGLHTAHSVANLLFDCAGAYFQPLSAYHNSPEILERVKLAAAFLERAQTDDGNIDLVSTNFNSPPDTAFVVHKVATAARLAQLHDNDEVLRLLRTFLRRAGGGMARGGIHTPNHRWVVCAALAQVNELFPDPDYTKRIDAWLAEGIDIDEEGQYIERSTAIYNGAVNHAFTVMAVKLQRPELLEPVRTNLEAMTYLVHPNGEVVTEISRRQDVGQRRGMENYWFALRYLAIQDNNGQYAAMLTPLEPERLEMPTLMEYPEMQAPLPEPTSLPESFLKEYPLSNIRRIRRRRLSATLLGGRADRRLVAHFGDVVVEGFRFASAFFGKGEFAPHDIERREDGFYFRQELRGQYFQPLRGEYLQTVTHENWAHLRMRRETSEICVLTYQAHIREIEGGFEIRVHASGTDNVPLAVEIGLRPGGELTGAVAVPHVSRAFLLEQGYAVYQVGNDALRIGPGKAEHHYTQVRGAAGRISDMSLYMTGNTPFEHVFTLEMVSP